MNSNYFPFTGTTLKPVKGFEPVDLKDWLELDSTDEKRLLLKEKIFRENKDLVLKITPGSEDACFELEQMVREHVLRHFSDQFSMAASELYVNSTGYSFSQAQTPEQALMNAAQYVQEDFAIFDSGELIAYANCFSQGLMSKPSHEVSDQAVQKISWTFQENDQLYPVKAASGSNKENVLNLPFARVEKQILQIMPKTKKVLLTARTYIYPVK